MFVRASAYVENCVGKLQSCRLLTSSFFASIKLPAYFSLRNPIVVCQFTVVGKVTTQLSKGTMVDNCTTVYIHGVNRNVRGAMSAHDVLHSKAPLVSLVKAMF